MTVIENINIAYVSQDLSLLSSADADGTKDLRYLSVFEILVVWFCHYERKGGTVYVTGGLILLELF